MGDHAELTEIASKLVFRHAGRRAGGVIVRAQALAHSPCGCQMWDRWEEFGPAHASIVVDGAICSTMELQPRHVRAAGIAQRLVGRIYRLDG